MATRAEIRGRNRAWTVWTPDESVRPMRVPLYDQEGEFKEWLMCGAPPDAKGPKLIERHGGPFPSIEEATEYARYLGYSDPRIVKTKTKLEALVVARAARKANSE